MKMGDTILELFWGDIKQLFKHSLGSWGLWHSKYYRKSS